MDFEEDAVQTLARRIKDAADHTSHPPSKVIHPAVMLLGADPEHLAATFVEQTDDKPAVWTVAAYHQGMVVTIHGEGRGARSWTWEGEAAGRGAEDPTVTAKARRLDQVAAVEIVGTDSWSQWGQGPSKSSAFAAWRINFTDGDRLDLPLTTRDRYVTGLVQAILTDLRNAEG